MRIVHARMKVFNLDGAFLDDFILATWMLSALKWKALGNDLIMYTDAETFENMKAVHLDELYDQIDTKSLTEETENIDLRFFWATPKLASLKKEIKKGYLPIISDTDVIPMSPKIMELFNNTKDLIVYSTKEFKEFHTIYPRLENISFPENYKLPKWFTGFAKPLNTAVLWFKDQSTAKFYLDEAFKIMIGNQNTKKNSTAQTMCNAEQRLLGEIVNYKSLSFNVVQPIDQGIINSFAIHTHGYKQYFVKYDRTQKLAWVLNLLAMIKDLNNEFYNKIINLPIFEAEKLQIENNSNPIPFVEELKIYNEEYRTLFNQVKENLDGR